MAFPQHHPLLDNSEGRQQEEEKQLFAGKKEAMKRRNLATDHTRIAGRQTSSFEALITDRSECHGSIRSQQTFRTEYGCSSSAVI